MTRTDYKQFYGYLYEKMCCAQNTVLNILQKYEQEKTKGGAENPIEHIKSRIKSPESMKTKLRKNNFPENGESALKNLHDAVGIRVVCGFLDTVYDVEKMFKEESSLNILTVKDYIQHPKKSGYRSLHLLAEIEHIPIEIQIRTIALDCWAALEHQIRYKKDIADKEILQKELKSCADQIASTDISMQTIRDILRK